MKKNIVSILIIFLTIQIFSNDYEKLIYDAKKESDLKKAISLIDNAKKIEPLNPKAYFYAGLIYYKNLDKYKFSYEFKRVVELTDNSNEKKELIKNIDLLTSTLFTKENNERYQKAYDAIENKKPEIAINLLEEAINSQNPPNYKLYYELSFAYIEINKIDKAIFYLEEAKLINPVNMGILNELRYAYSHIGNIEKLREVITDIINFFGDDPSLYQELAFAYLKQYNLNLAIQTLELNIKKFPDFYISHYSLGQLYYKNNDLEKAKNILNLFINNATDEVFKKYRINASLNDCKEEAKKILSNIK